jgi:hypothetical protein
MTPRRSVHALRQASLALLIAVPLSAAAQQPRKAPDEPARGGPPPSAQPARPVMRTRPVRPLDVKLNSLKLNGSVFGIEAEKTEKVTATWQLDASQVGAATGVQIRIREGAIAPGDCPGKRDDALDSAYLPGLNGSFDLPLTQPKFAIGNTYAVKGCLMDPSAQYTGDETNTVVMALTEGKKTAKYKLTGLEKLSGKAYDAEAFASTGPGFIQASYYLGLGEPIKLRTTVKNVGGGPANVRQGQTVALTIWLDGKTWGIGTIVNVPALAAGHSRDEVLTMATGGTSGVDKGLYQISIELEQPEPVPSADKVVVLEGPKIYIQPHTWSLWPVMIRIYKPGNALGGPGAIRVRVRNYGSAASFPTTVHVSDDHGCYPTVDLPLAAIPAYGGAGSSSSLQLAWGIPLSDCVPKVHAVVHEADPSYPSFSTTKVTTFTDLNAYLAN